MSRVITVEERVFDLIYDVGINTAEEIVPGADFVFDLGFDSLDCVELLMDLEDEFNMSIPDEDAETLTTVGSVSAYLRAKGALNEVEIDPPTNPGTNPPGQG